MRITWEFMTRVGEAEAIPRGYGLVYEDFARAEGIFLPIPLNLIARFACLMYQKIAMGLFRANFEKKIHKAISTARQEGWEIGKKFGYEQGRQDAQREISQRVEAYLEERFGYLHKEKK